MVLVQELTYKSHIKELTKRKTPDIIGLLKDVKETFSKLDPKFKKKSLRDILKLIEKGSDNECKIRIKGKIPYEVDISEAAQVIEFYREHSEGGCKSCVSLRQETIDAQDATSGWYCQVSDPDYDANVIGRPGVRYSGFSPKVNKHYENPCEDWAPHFQKRLEELISVACA